MNAPDNKKEKTPFLMRFAIALGIFSLVGAIVISIYYYNSLYKKIDRDIQLRLLSKQAGEISQLLESEKANSVLMRRYANTFFRAGKLAFQAKAYDKAIEYYDMGLRLNPWEQDKVLALASAYEKKGDYEQSLERINNVLNNQPSFFIRLRAQQQKKMLLKRYMPIKEHYSPVKPEERRLRAVVIYLVPLGFDNKGLMEDLRLAAQDALGIKFEVLPAMAGQIPGFSKKRNQFFCDPLADYVKTKYKDYLSRQNTAGVLVVTSFDITAENLNFLFGWVDRPYNTIGIISFRRFMSDKPDDKMLFKRIYTQLLSTGGFILGVPRCSFSGCARSYPHSFAEFQKKSYKLCSECCRNLSDVVQKLSDFPEEKWPKEDLVRLQEIKAKYGIDQ